MDPDIKAACWVWNKYQSSADAIQAVYDDAKPDDSEETSERVARMLAWAWQWAEDGFWTLTCGHKYGAALACTSTRALEDIELPARAVRVNLPHELIGEGRNSVNFIYLHAAAGYCNLMFSNQREWDGLTDPDWGTGFARSGPSLDAILADDDDGAEVLGEERARMGVLAARVLGGLLYTMQHTNNFKTKSYQTPGLGHGSGRNPPDHRVVFVGKPISIDARPQLETWLSSGRNGAPPALQYIVRGHYKRQVIGIGRAGRKVIWVEPYWRGPEEAPILIHPRRVG